jgi:hypothetical protein
MVIDEKMANPFRNQTSVNIVTGQIADSGEILQAKEKGLSALSEAEERGSFKVEKVKLKPLEKVKKKVPISKTPHQKKKKKFTWRKIRCQCLCALQLVNWRGGRIDAFSHEWADYPCLLFQPDEENPTGYSMRKRNKADFVNALQVTLKYENS